MGRRTRLLFGLIAALATCEAQLAETERGHVGQSQREITVMTSVDVVVVGGTVAGVAAAEAAARDGAKVHLIAPRPYLGEDLCATLRLELQEGRSLETDLEKKLFGNDRRVTPAHVKATLDKVLLEAGVEFSLASIVSDVLRDDKGQPCGVVMCNRAGRQAIVSKTVIDATHYAWVGRQAGCASYPWPGGKVIFERVVLQPAGKGKGGGQAEKKPKGKSLNFESRVHKLEIEMGDLTFRSLAQAEQVARERTYSDDLLRGAESLFCVPPLAIRCVRSQKDFKDAASVDLAHFRPVEQTRLYVLSGCADIPRTKAAELLRPAALARIGADVGRAAAAEAKAQPRPSGVRVPAAQSAVVAEGDIREILSGVRSVDRKQPAVPGEATRVPVLADVDVVVVGGGTAGGAAAIAAARRGARTLVIEYQEGLGGVGTLGLIGKAYHGRKAGFAKEVPFPENAEQKMEWYRKELAKAGGTAWFGVLGCGAFLEGNLVKGAVVCTPEGRGVILAKVVIDATGSGDVAISAGADYMFGAIEEGDIALQGTGLPARDPGSDHANSDYLVVDESDMIDVWRALVSVQLAKKDSYDTGTLIQTRERRRVIGDFVMRYVDQVAGRTYPDSVVFSASDYDSHGYPSSPFFALLPHDEKSRKANHPAPGGACYTPYRCLLPRGLDGILVAGLGISMNRDATAMVRMQLDMANQGYAAGVAAAMAVQGKTQPRRIDVRALQKHLVETGCLNESVLTDGDSFPLPVATVQQSVVAYGKATNPGSAGKALGIMLTHEGTAKPLIRQAYDKAEGQGKLRYAQLLAVLGDKDVVPTLVSALGEIGKWDAKIYQGRMADYAHLPTPVDAIILALGYAGDRSATPAILRMLNQLDASVTLSHHRSVALALERLGDPSAAGPLAGLLQKPGMQGYAMTALPKEGKLEKRAESFREIFLARALYRCGDREGLGKRILEKYRSDLRGLFARHAQAVLEEK